MKGKYTPTRSELGPSQPSNRSKFSTKKSQNSQNMSLMKISSLILSQKLPSNPRIAIPSDLSSFVRCLSSSQSTNQSKISLETFENFVRNQGRVKTEGIEQPEEIEGEITKEIHEEEEEKAE